MGAKKEYIADVFNESMGYGLDKSITPKEAWQKTTSMISAEISKEKNLNKAKQLRKELIAKRLSALREETGDKQKVVADAIGVNVMTLSGYETAKAEPNHEVTVRLADYYKVSLDYLVCRTDTRTKYDPEEYTAKDKDRKQKLERLQQLEEELAEIKQELK